MSVEFAWPFAFLLIAIPIAVRLLAPRSVRRQAALTVPDVSAFRLETIDEMPRSARSLFSLALLWLGWALMVTALARPQMIGEPISFPTSGRDLMLAVDISGSMSTEDMALRGEQVTRLAVVKAVVRDFISRRTGDRVGLVLFGTNAYVQAPLTFDLGTIEQLLIEAPVGIAGGKTAIGDAIGLAVKRLRDRPAASRVLVLLTDGSNNVGEIAPLKAAELARDIGVRVHTIGVGADEMEISSLFGFGRRMVNPSADLDEAALREIADTTGGRYFRAADTQALVGIYDEIAKLEPVEQDPETFRPVKALYFWPLGLSVFVFLVLLLMVSRTRA